MFCELSLPVQLHGLPSSTTTVRQSKVGETEKSVAATGISLSMPPTAKPVATAQPALTCLPFPAEIRDRIYRNVLISDASPPLTLFRKGGPDTTCLSLLLASKRTYLEAFHIFYRHNVFEFKDTTALGLFLEGIGRARRFYVSHIYFPWKGPLAKEAFYLLQRCPNLRNLVVQMTSDYIWKNSNEAYGADILGEVRGLEGVKFAGLEHGDFNSIARQDPNNLVGHRNPDRFIDRLWTHIVYEMGALRDDMLRPRLGRFAPRKNEEIDLFAPSEDAFRGLKAYVVDGNYASVS